jgi:riboflavin-specific deaminase-like protein
VACLCCGDWTSNERLALDLYGPLVDPARKTSVVAQIGQSLDGRIATVSCDAQDVSGVEGLEHLHRLRALVDAVVIGVRTALHDSPRLTVRLAQGENPARVVIDPAGRLPDDAHLLTDASARRIIIQAVDRPRPDGIEVITLPRSDWISTQDIVSSLQKVGLNRLLVEGGAITIAQFLEAGLLSRLHVAVAPLLIGAGPQGLTLQPVASLALARRPATNVYSLGSDVLFDCALNGDLAPAALCEQAIPAGVQQC